MGNWIDPSRERKTKTAYIGLSARHAQSMVQVTKYILDKGLVPLHPTLRSDTIGRQASAQEAEKNKDYFIRNCDEMWVFGPLSKPVFEDIKVVKRLAKPVRFFSLTEMGGIVEISKEQVDTTDLQ